MWPHARQSYAPNRSVLSVLEMQGEGDEGTREGGHVMKRAMLIMAMVASLGACGGGDEEPTCYQDPATGNVGCALITDEETCVGGIYNGTTWVSCE